MTIYWIKIIACLTMILDHVKYAIPNITNELTHFAGRIAFPLFCFCIVEGYIHTSNIKKYLKRIAILAIVSQIPYMLFTSLPTLNIFAFNSVFTLFLGFITIILIQKTNNKFLKAIIIIGTCCIAEFLRFDYGAWGIALIMSLYIFRESKIKTATAFVIVVSVKYLFRIYYYKFGFTEEIVKYWIYTIIPIIFILLYNGKEGVKVQKFYYWFYPTHLLLLYLVSPFTLQAIKELCLKFF